MLLIVSTTFLVGIFLVRELLAGRSAFIRNLGALIGGIVASFTVGFLTLFEPFVSDPSPIPLSQEYLEMIFVAIRVTLIAIGCYLVWHGSPQRHRLHVRKISNGV